MEWPNLPEDYGDGQRQLDMALAANAAAEPIAYFAAIGAAYMAGTLINFWLAPVTGIGIYFIFEGLAEFKTKPSLNALSAQVLSTFR